MKTTKRKPPLHPPKPLETPEEMTAPKRTFLNARWAFVSLLLMAAVLWLVGKGKSKQSEWENTPQGANSPDAIIEKFHLISTVQGEKKWELHSSRAEMYQNQKKAFADDIFSQYFKNNRLVSTLTADKALINTETNETKVEGHVELVTENGSKLETDKLNWDPDKDEIKTDRRVHIYKGMDEITAVGLTADTQLNNIRFMRDVRTQVRDMGEVEHFNEPKKF